MKNNCISPRLFAFTISMLAMFSFGITKSVAQEWDHEYVPFVEEGKVWYCKDGQITPEDPWGSDIDCIFTLQGDTLIGENNYKKVFCQYENYYGDKDLHYYCAVREESYQVFLVEEEANEEILLYDFSQPRKTIAFERNKLRFARCAGYHIDEIIWQTHQYDFWLFAYNANGEIDYSSCYCSWTEGAGYTYGNPFALELSYYLGSSSDSKLGPLGVVTCMKGEKLLFSEEWLWIMVGPGTTSVEPVKKGIPSHASSTYDLQGRRITDTPQRGMYIRDGKKYVVK